MEEGFNKNPDGMPNQQQASNEYYRQLFDEAIEGICLADPETGIILDCNQAFSRLMEYDDRSELIGQPQTILHPAEEGNPSVTHSFDLHRSGKKGQVIQDRIVTKGGLVKEVDIKADLLDLDGRLVMHAFFRDRTEELRNRHEREATLNLMRLLNDRNQTHELIRNLCDFIHHWSGCEAVGIRLQVGDDFPYFETRGFPGEFVEAENYLCQRDLDDQVLRDELGNPLLDCMCGNILRGRFDPTLPFFTKNGSFCSNCTTELLATTTEAQRQSRTRNRCNGEGYESVALIPLRHGDRILGLLQLNDHTRGRFSPELILFLENMADQIAIALAQRQAQAALEISEARYRGLFENMAEGCAYHRMIFENGKPTDYIFLSVNESFKSLTGLKDVVGKRVSDVIPGFIESDAELFAIYARVATTGKPEKFERYVEAMKSWYHISVYCPEREYFVAMFDVITERKNAEFALRKSEDLFSKAFKGSPLAMVITSMVDRRIIDVNEAFEAITGYSRSEAVGRDFRSFGLFLDLDAMGEAMRAARILGSYHGMEFALRTKSGQCRTGRLSAETVDIAGELCALTIAEDISERKLSEEALRLSEERFRQMFEHMGSGMVVYEPVDDGADFLIKEFNPAAERMAKISRDEVVGRPASETFPDLERIGLVAGFRRVWRSGVPEHHPACLYDDGRLRIWIENYLFKLPSGEVVTIVDNITDRKAAEAEVKKSEIWHRSLIELGVSVYVVLDEKRLIHYASPLVEKVLGWKTAEVLQKSIFDFVAAENAESASRFFTDILRAPKRKKRMIIRIRCKSGELKAMEFFGINLLDEPAVRGIVLSTHDISEQVRAQERVETFREELTHASRLASMGALTAGIAHEINQPLAIMATWAEIASREIRDHLSGDKQEALLALMRIDTAMERSAHIIQRMKDFARKSEPHVTKVSIIEAIEEVQLMIDHQLRASGVTLSVEIGPSLPPALADRIQVQQVLTNLIMNAVDAMKNVVSQQGSVEIYAKTKSGMLEVSVSDSGCSIPIDRLETVFEPFHSTKPEGLGLGLSICRTIIQWHGGRIWATRNAEHGTTVSFTLPIALEKHPHATEHNHLHRGRRTRSP
jgi:PAS domain S-box-containing protein